MAVNSQNVNLEEIERVLREQNEELTRLSESPLVALPVVYADKKHLFMAMDGNMIRVMASKKIPLKAGDYALCANGQVVEKLVGITPNGVVYIVSSASDQTCEIESGGGPMVVFNGDAIPGPGDRVILDRSKSVIVTNLGKQNKRFTSYDLPNVGWDDIGGLDEAKLQMREAIELPFQNVKLYQHYNRRAEKGMLLYGPPGCGKTMLGKAAATSLAKLHNTDGAGSGFIYLKAPELLNKYVGEGEATVRSIYMIAKDHKREHGYPALIFIDEADAIMSKRGGDNGSFFASHMVTSFLTEMDGMEDSAAITVLATNRPDTLDPAVVRDGRINRKIKIGRPEQKDADNILRLYLDKVPMQKKLNASEVAGMAAASVFDKDRAIYGVIMKDGSREQITLAQTVNGAMLANIVDFSSTLAMRRDMRDGGKSGVCSADVIEAIDRVHDGMHDIDATDVIQEVMDSRVDDIASIVRLRRKERSLAEAA